MKVLGVSRVGIILEQVGAKLTTPERITTLWLALQRASSINEKTGSEEGRRSSVEMN